MDIQQLGGYTNLSLSAMCTFLGSITPGGTRGEGRCLEKIEAIIEYVFVKEDLGCLDDSKKRFSEPLSREEEGFILPGDWSWR